VANPIDPVDAALLAKLNDPALAALMPDGVFFDLSPPNAKRFVLVTLLLAVPTHGFDPAPLYETSIYLVEAYGLSSSGPDAGVNEAADRIYELLHRQPLTIAGAAHMQTLRTRRTRPPATVDPQDADLRWQRRGGHYEISVSPI